MKLINIVIKIIFFFYYGIITNVSFLKSLKMEAVVSEMKRQLEDGDLKLDQKISLLNDGINSGTVFTLPVSSG